MFLTFKINGWLYYCLRVINYQSCEWYTKD